MSILKPCPFCKSDTGLETYRYDVCGFLQVRERHIEEIKPYGDTFRIKCICGCRFDKHVDDLYTQLEDKYGYDEFEDDDLWDMMISLWNGDRE